MKPPSKPALKQRQKILSIAGSHLLNDLYTAFFAPLLPNLVSSLNLSLTSAGILTSFLQLPSVFYPVIGYLADKKGARYLVIFSPAITATLMSLIGGMNSFYGLAAVLFLAGTSSTIFHAASPGLVASASGERRGFGLSVFMAGGGLGRSLGPILAVWAVSFWGLQGTFRLMFLGWAASLILLLQFRKVDFSQDRTDLHNHALPALGRFFFPLALVLVLRSFLTAALSSYLPLYLVQSGSPLGFAGAALSVLEISGVLGALLMGPVSDRIGRRRSIVFSQAVSACLIPLFLRAEGWHFFPLLLLLGFFNLSTGTLYLTLVQDYFPDHRSTGNGFYLLISFLSNGLMAILVGITGDLFSLRLAFLVGSAATIIAIPALQLLPVEITAKHAR